MAKLGFCVPRNFWILQKSEIFFCKYVAQPYSHGDLWDRVPQITIRKWTRRKQSIFFLGIRHLHIRWLRPAPGLCRDFDRWLKPCVSLNKRYDFIGSFFESGSAEPSSDFLERGWLRCNSWWCPSWSVLAPMHLTIIASSPVHLPLTPDPIVSRTP